jgi:hypothetical protein
MKKMPGRKVSKQISYASKISGSQSGEYKHYLPSAMLLRFCSHGILFALMMEAAGSSETSVNSTTLSALQARRQPSSYSPP